MGLDKLIPDDERTEKSNDGNIDDVTVPEWVWRYFLKSTKGNFPVDEDEMELWELEAVLSFIDSELNTSLPFSNTVEDIELKYIKRNRDKLEEKIEEMK